MLVKGITSALAWVVNADFLVDEVDYWINTFAIEALEGSID